KTEFPKAGVRNKAEVDNFFSALDNNGYDVVTHQEFITFRAFMTVCCNGA
uniref:EF-hand domain-containing protein n=1 Tax=Sparus aurata TaxID=8175 RepID=A0A671WB87_SPAAU